MKHNEKDIESIHLRVNTEVKQTELIIHNIYNSCSISTSFTGSPSTLPQLAEALAAPGEHLVVGDFNLHHPYWGGPRCLTRHAMADKTIEIATATQLNLLLPAGTITREQNQQKTTIDLC